MAQKTKAVIAVAAFALLLAAAAVGYRLLSGRFGQKRGSAPSAPKPASSAAADAAPDFTVVDVHNRQVSLSQFKGRPVVVNFWASWCQYCVKEMPDYEKMYRKYGPKGVVFMMVDVIDGYQETVDVGKKFIESMKYRFPVYFDTESTASAAYAVFNIPASIFIGRDGKVSDSHTGRIEAAELEANIKKLLG